MTSLSFDEAKKKIDDLAQELDDNGFTSILILRADIAGGRNHMVTTYPPTRRQSIPNLIGQAQEQILAGKGKI